MRYQFKSQGFQNDYFGHKKKFHFSPITVIIALNILIFLFSNNQWSIHQIFGVSTNNFIIWQPLTYMFFHGGIWHVLINMFVLWMFGSELERLWGKNHFLKFYFITGVGSGLVTMLVNVQSITPVVGASGAVYGVLLAYGLTYPNRTVYLYGIIPIKSLWFVLGIGFIAFMSSFDNMSQVSHVTHLSGMLIGYFMLKKPIKLKGLWFQLRKKTLEYQIQREEKELSKNFIVEQDINQILDKINQEGFDSLTDEEQDRLYKGSQSLSRGRKKD